MVFPHIPYVLPAKNHIGTDPPTDGPGLRGTRRRPTGNPVPEFRLFRNRNPTVAFRAARRYSRRMRTVTLDFSHMVRRDPPGIVCLVGGGGKTTLLYALGRALGTADTPSLCTTTTRIFPPEAEQCRLVLSTDPQKLEVPDGLTVFCAAGPAPAGSPKLLGFPPEALDALSLRRPEWSILVEADGAAGRPVKAPLPHEPVIPSRTRAVVAVFGLSGLNRPLTDDSAFRLEHTARIAGIAPGDTLTPAAAARLFRHAEGLFQHSPAGAERFVFLNQADLPGAHEAGTVLAEILLRAAPDARVLIGAVATEGLCCTRILP